MGNPQLMAGSGSALVPEDSTSAGGWEFPHPFPWEHFSSISQFVAGVTCNQNVEGEVQKVLDELSWQLEHCPALQDKGIIGWTKVDAFAKNVAMPGDALHLVITLETFPLKDPATLLAVLQDTLAQSLGCKVEMGTGRARHLVSLGDQIPFTVELHLGAFPPLHPAMGEFFLSLGPSERQKWDASMRQYHTLFWRHKCDVHLGLRDAVVCLRSWKRALGLAVPTLLIELLAVYGADEWGRRQQGLLRKGAAPGGTSVLKMSRHASGCMLGFATIVRRVVDNPLGTVVSWTWETGGFYGEPCLAPVLADARERQTPAVINPVDPTHNVGSVPEGVWGELAHHSRILMDNINDNKGLYCRLVGAFHRR